jgi:hypothetical protein
MEHYTMKMWDSGGISSPFFTLALVAGESTDFTPLLLYLQGNSVPIA